MAGLAEDWRANRQTCVDVLCAYLRLPHDPSPGEEAEDKRAQFTDGSVSLERAQFADSRNSSYLAQFGFHASSVCRS